MSATAWATINLRAGLLGPVAKSITSLLVGAAVRDGYIESVDEKVVDYLRVFKESAYAGATIRNVLHMASGVAWNEDYVDPQSDVNRAPWGTLSLQRFLRDKGAIAEPGTVFNYNTAESNLVGTLLRAAIGNNLSTYLSEKIWQPVGMETDAYWTLTEPGGGEFGGCCLSITLRDYARIGLCPARGTPGRRHAGAGRRLDARRDAALASRARIRLSVVATRRRLLPRQRRIWPGISIHPQKSIIIALNSARPNASTPEDSARQEALFTALTNALVGAK